MNPENQLVCSYVSPNKTRCNRICVDYKPYCCFHLKKDASLIDTDFEHHFKGLLEAKDGNWQGFLFPIGIELPKQVDFPIDARWARFVMLEQEKIVFKESVDFSNAIFSSNVIFRTVTFEKPVNFDHCRFESVVDFQHVECKDQTSFYRADFSGRTILRAYFFRPCSFNEAIFRDSVSFHGWRAVTLSSNLVVKVNVGTPRLLTSKKPTIRQRITELLSEFRSWLFFKCNSIKGWFIRIVQKIQGWFFTIKRRFATEDQNITIFRIFDLGGSFEGVVFLKPDQTLFSLANLSRVHFRGTNLRGVRFLDVNWWQPELGRNGLYDEVFIRLSEDGPFRYGNLPALEETCRNARVALEENRSFNAASDFYIGEMETARARLPFLRRHIFSVLAWYRFVSNYGTSVGTAIRILIYLFFFHLALSVRFSSTGIDFQNVDLALKTFKVLTLQKIIENPNWIDAVFTVLAPIQITMLVMAFRSRIKRSHGQ